MATDAAMRHSNDPTHQQQKQQQQQQQQPVHRSISATEAVQILLHQQQEVYGVMSRMDSVVQQLLQRNQNLEEQQRNLRACYERLQQRFEELANAKALPEALNSSVSSSVPSWVGLKRPRVAFSPCDSAFQQPVPSSSACPLPQPVYAAPPMSCPAPPQPLPFSGGSGGLPNPAPALANVVDDNTASASSDDEFGKGEAAADGSGEEKNRPRPRRRPYPMNRRKGRCGFHKEFAGVRMVCQSTTCPRGRNRCDHENAETPLDGVFVSLAEHGNNIRRERREQRRARRLRRQAAAAAKSATMHSATSATAVAAASASPSTGTHHTVQQKRMGQTLRPMLQPLYPPPQQQQQQQHPAM